MTLFKYIEAYYIGNDKVSKVQKFHHLARPLLSNEFEKMIYINNITL